MIFLPASRTESSTTAFPEPSIISNSVTVPSDSTFSFTVTCQHFSKRHLARRLVPGRLESVCQYPDVSR